MNDVLLTLSMEKPFPLLVTNLDGFFLFKDFAKTSLNVKKEKSYSKFGFLENGVVFVRSSDV